MHAWHVARDTSLRTRDGGSTLTMGEGPPKVMKRMQMSKRPNGEYQFDVASSATDKMYTADWLLLRV